MNKRAEQFRKRALEIREERKIIKDALRRKAPIGIAHGTGGVTQIPYEDVVLMYPKLAKEVENE